MPPPLQAVPIQLHFNQRSQLYNLQLINLKRLFDVWGDRRVLKLYLSTSEPNVHALTRPTCRSVKKDDGVHSLVAHKTRLLQGRARTRQIGLLEKQVYIACIAYSAIVNRRDQRSFGVAANDCIGNVCSPRCLTRSIQSLLNQLHGSEHPFKNIDRRLLHLALGFIYFHHRTCTRG